MDKKYQIIPRKRVDLMLQKAVQHGVVLLTAGSGYGKTHALHPFVRQKQYRHIWLELSALDQEADHFWDTFLLAVRAYCAPLYEALEEFDFPGTKTSFAAFIRLFTQELYQGSRVLLAVDNYDRADNYHIDQFFRQIIELEPENLCVLLVTREKSHLTLSACERNELYWIGQEDLTFTKDEIEAAFFSSGVQLSDRQLREIHTLTDGFPAAISVLLQSKDLSPQGIDRALSFLDAMFEETVSLCSPQIQTLLIHLSAVEAFSVDLICTLGAFDPIELFQVLRKNPYISYDRNQSRYRFWRLYRDFLQRKDVYSGTDARRTLFAQAGERNLADGRIQEAISCFLACQDYDKVLSILAETMDTLDCSNRERMDFFATVIDGMEPSQVSDPLLFSYVNASILLSRHQAEPAKAILSALREQLPPGALLSEVYGKLGFIAFLSFDTIFLEYFQTSLDLCPDLKKSFFIGNVDLFRIPNWGPGAVGDAKEIVARSAFFWSARFGSAAIVQLYFALADFHTFQLDSARVYADKAVQLAFQGKQHDVLCLATRILSLISLLDGAYERFIQQNNFIIEYIDVLGLDKLSEIKEGARALLRFIGKGTEGASPEDVSFLLINESSSSLTFGVNRFILADYLFQGEQFDALMPILQQAEAEYSSPPHVAHLILIHVLRAMVYFKLGQQAEAVESFRRAYEMAYHNTIITSFVQRGDTMLAFLRTLPPDSGFDPDWIKQLTYQTSVFVKRYARMNQIQIAKGPTVSLVLTKREKEVLQDLSTGLTREEISATRYIAISTVKTIITSIYNKLGAVNRADAVRIAAKRNLLS